MAKASASIQIWDLWFPQGGATGVPFARGRLDNTPVLLVHAPPPTLTIEIRSDAGRRLAFGKDLVQTADRPMARLIRKRNKILREDLWPTQDDIGLPVILPGGEVGILKQWWNASNGSEWRWQIEFYNHR
jgi:hypothetical protein